MNRAMPIWIKRRGSKRRRPRPRSTEKKETQPVRQHRESAERRRMNFWEDDPVV